MLIELTGADGIATGVADWGLYYGGSSPNVITFPTGAAMETFTLLTSKESPTMLLTDVELSTGLELKAVDDNAVAIVDSDQLPLLFVDAPWAVDATGVDVPLTMSVQGNTIATRIDHTSDEYQYPIVVDPVWYYFGYGYQVNHAEFEYCKWPSRHRICFFAFSEARSALALAAAYFRSGLHNGRGDAFRHCYWSAAMTIRLSQSKAREFGDLHESDTDPNNVERRMDERNNAIGRSLGRIASSVYGGSKSWAEAECLDRADNGRLWIINSRNRLVLG